MYVYRYCVFSMESQSAVRGDRVVLAVTSPRFLHTKSVLVASWSNYQISWCLSNIMMNSVHPYVAFVSTFHFFVPWWLELRTCLLSHIKLQGSEQHHWASTCCPPRCRWTADLGKRWGLFQRDVAILKVVQFRSLTNWSEDSSKQVREHTGSTQRWVARISLSPS